jgi:hypothetical protein
MCHITTMGSNGQLQYTATTPENKAAFESSEAGRQAYQQVNFSPMGNDRVTFSPEAMASMGG